jgi:hypothetical protein
MMMLAKKSILAGAMMASFNVPSAFAEDAFKSLGCFEDGYSATYVELKVIGDQLAFSLVSPYVGARHPEIQIDSFEFNIPLEGCTFDANLPGVVACTAQNGEVISKTGRAQYKSFAYDQLSLKVSAFESREGKPGRKVAIQASGGEVSPAFSHEISYETKIPDGPYGITSYCVLNGNTRIDRK